MPGEEEEASAGLLINNKPIESFIPLGEPEHGRQWVVSLLLISSATQGMALGLAGLLSVRLKLLDSLIHLDLDKSTDPLSLEDEGFLEVTQGFALFFAAPIVALAVDNRSASNVQLQIFSLLACIAGTLLAVLQPLVEGDDDSNPKHDQHLLLSSLKWLGFVVFHVGAAAVRPLMTVLVANQVRDTELQGPMIGWNYVSYTFGYFLSIILFQFSLKVWVVGIIQISCLLCSTIIMYSLMANNLLGEYSGPLIPNFWRLSGQHAGASGTELGEVRSRYDPYLTRISDYLTSYPSIFSETSSQSRQNFIKIITLALGWRIVSEQKLLWHVQSWSMNDKICIGSSKNATMRSANVTGGDNSDCIELGSNMVSFIGSLLGLMLFTCIHSGGIDLKLSVIKERISFGFLLTLLALLFFSFIQLCFDLQDVSILWQLPQFLLLHAADGFITYSALEYAYMGSADWPKAGAAASFFGFQMAEENLKEGR